MRQIIAVLFICFAGSFATGAEYWSQFRGPQGDGDAGAATLPIKWSETESIAWKTPIDGKAWSSPVVWGDEIWLSNATVDGKRLSAVSVDGKSGKVI
ncbi:MAG TPA: quinonprotein alcohol dehydrogenase, partial [Pirellulaceae bacterium]|nr:quinonprotein alcohol dehydrogenase [Pirellulaceae bacterium]